MKKSWKLVLFIGALLAVSLLVDDVVAGAITDLKVTTCGSKVVLEFDLGPARRDEMTLHVNITKTDDLVKIDKAAVEGSDYGVVSLGHRKRMIWNIQNSSDDSVEPVVNRGVVTIKSASSCNNAILTSIFNGF